MGKKANFEAGGGGKFFTAPVGSHPAIIVGIAELGHADFTYEGKTKHQDEIRVFFEIGALVNTAEEGQPEKMEEKVFITEQNYAFKVGSKSNLGKMIAGVYGIQPELIKDFDIEDMLGRKCVISVTHNKNGFPKVESVSQESGKMIYHTQEEANFYFSLEDMENFDEDRFNKFAPFVQKRIKESDEFIEAFGANFEETPSALDKEEAELKKEAEDKKQAPVNTEANEFNSPNGVVDPAQVEANTQQFREESSKEDLQAPATVEDNPFAKKD